jgi:death-on-curing protein
MDEPQWVPRIVADAIHFAQLQEHGGAHGTRDRGAVDTALDRPKNRLAYVQGADIADLAAAYLYGLATSHGYVDGNKRTAIAVALVFLELNGYELQRSDRELEEMVIAVVTHDASDSEVARWVREALVPSTPSDQVPATRVPDE